jgi:hypothetical protein
LVLERDGWRCQLAIPRVCETRAGEVHHTVGRAVSGDDPAFLVAACRPCNQSLGDVRATDPEPVADPEPVPRTVW